MLSGVSVCVDGPEPEVITVVFLYLPLFGGVYEGGADVKCVELKTLRAWALGDGCRDGAATLAARVRPFRP